MKTRRDYRPFPSMHAREATVIAVRRAGRQGGQIGDGVSVSSAIRMAMLGLVTITAEHPQRLLGPPDQSARR